MPAVLFNATFFDPALWVDALKGADPALELRVWPEVGNRAEIDVVLGWGQPRNSDKTYPNLKLIQALGAGVDHIMRDPARPPEVPVARLIDRALTTGMSEYVLLAVLRYHRQLPLFEAAQAKAEWLDLAAPDTTKARVGILGLGALGTDAALKLSALGFPVAGWSRTPKAVPGIESFHGADGLPRFLARTQFLVCLLPLTPDTRGIINATTLSQLPAGAYVINPGRGGHVVDEDLLAALDSGHIAHATLDVFNREPLPAEHLYWRHPKVTVTPHSASVTVPESAAPQIVENIRRVREGLAPHNLVDPARGY